MKAETRERVLGLVSKGYDLEAAAAEAGAKMADVQADPELQAGLISAWNLGTAQLRAKLTALALNGGDGRLLERLIDGREAAARRFMVERPAVAAEDADGGMAWRLQQLSTAELAVVEWVATGEGRERPEQLYDSVDLTLKIFEERKEFEKERAEWKRERAAPRWPRELPVIDSEKPSPPGLTNETRHR